MWGMGVLTKNRWCCTMYIKVLYNIKDRIFMPGGGSGFQLKVEQITSNLK